MNDNGGPAFPIPMFAIGHAKYEAKQQGLTLRDYFAAKAMQGLLASTKTSDGNMIVRDAYAIADAMLKARES